MGVPCDSQQGGKSDSGCTPRPEPSLSSNLLRSPNKTLPVSGLQSTIDLTFVHRDLLPNAPIYVGPHIGRDAWDDFVNNLDHRANYSVFRGFTRKMLGNGFTPGLVRSLILLPSGVSLSYRRTNVACLSISFTSIIQHAFKPTITSHGSCK